MDPDNILSILDSLSGNPSPSVAPVNVLQSVAPQAPQPSPAAEIAQAAVAASPPTPKPRRSLVDIIGHVADAFAQAGGATPMYQRTLDAEQQRITDAQDRGLKVDSETIKNATDKFALDTSQRKRIGTALSAVSGQDNAADLWPSIAEQAGIDPARAQAIGQMLRANPQSASVLAKSLGGGEDKLGHNLYFGTGPDGKTVAYQIGDDGTPHLLDFGAAGVTPTTPIKVIDTGDKSVIVGQNGLPIKILPNTPKPDTVLTTTTSRENNQATNATNLTIAGMPARAKDATANGKASDPNAGLQIISDIQQSFDKLHSLQALPGEGSAIGNAVGAIGRTALGQTVEAKLGLSAAAQEREILTKNLNTLQSNLIQSLPGNATRTRFEQEIQKKRLPDPTTMTYATANRAIAQIRQAYETALKSQPAAKAAPANSSLPRLSPADAAKLAPGTPFIGLDGVQRVRH